MSISRLCIMENASDVVDLLTSIKRSLVDLITLLSTEPSSIPVAIAVIQNTPS